MRKLRNADPSSHKAKRLNRGRLERSLMRSVHLMQARICETQLNDCADE